MTLRDPLREPLADPEDRRREREAEMLVWKVRAIHGKWQVADRSQGRKHGPPSKDVMILVRRRTHLEIYERALRQAGIPFVTSRQGGLLDRLEAQEMAALLEFLVSPFADLKLAHACARRCSRARRGPIAIAAAEGKENEDTWWERLQRLAARNCGHVQTRSRSAHAVARTADSAPVHDQLDRIYFEADALRRYHDAVPEAMRGAVLANLHAFLQRALDTDSGRYPSLPRFLHELMDLGGAARRGAG